MMGCSGCNDTGGASYNSHYVNQVADALMKATGDDISVTEMSCAELFSGAPVAILHVPADCTGPLNVVRYLAVIRLTAVQPRRRGRGLETAEQAEERAKLDVSLVAVLSDAGLRRSEASALTWGDVQRWDDGSGRVTIIRSKTDVEAQGAVVAITPSAMQPPTPSGRRALVAMRKCSGCRSRRSPGG